MNTSTHYRQVIQEILTSYSRTPHADGQVQFETVFDRESDRYVVMIFGQEKERRVHGCLLHLEIIDDKIWIRRDDTEGGITNELMNAGVPQEHIVSELYPPDHHNLTQLAVVEETHEAYILQEDASLIDSPWDDLFADLRSEEVFLAFAKEARETAEADLWSLEDSGL